ncbi:hypothetical protein ACFLX9_00915 [Chloroflexota bacterium]
MKWYKVCPRCVRGDMEVASDKSFLVRRCVLCGYEETFAPGELAWAVESPD